jgi:hypothetical protein
MIIYEDFEKVDIRLGKVIICFTILLVRMHAQARSDDLQAGESL